jgi:hypothetical protein
MTTMAELAPRHFLWQVSGGVARIRLAGPSARTR